MTGRTAILVVTTAALFACAAPRPTPAPCGETPPTKADLGPDQERAALARRLIEAVRPLHRTLGARDREGWLAQRHEDGQTFDAWLSRGPELATATRRTIYIQPLGRFSRREQKRVAKVAAFLRIYFGLPVRLLDAEPWGEVPAEARRTHPEWGDRQIDTTWVLHQRLAPRLPDDAAALVALTGHDLWPGEDWKGGGWNYLHGMASHRKRVGVWSWYRLAGRGEKRTLLRTIKTASHELGHTFSMLHCTAYRCNMQGRISVVESDRTPLALGPECLGKLLYATGADPATRYDQLAAFARREGFRKEAAFYRKSARAVRRAKATKPGGK